MLAKGREFIRHVLPAVIKPARTLWNEVIGFVFIALAVWAAPSALRAAREFKGDSEGFLRLGLIGVFEGVMLWFGISSFLRARKISRS